MKFVPWIVILLLIIAHQDYWQWSRDELLYGFLPYPLAYHMGLDLENIRHGLRIQVRIANGGQSMQRLFRDRVLAVTN